MSKNAFSGERGKVQAYNPFIRFLIVQSPIVVTKSLPLRLKIVQMKIKEDDNNIYIEDYIIPKGMEKKDLKAREKIINEIYHKWFDSNPERCTYNHNLNDFIHIRFESINETINKAARTCQSTIVMFQLTDILQKAKVIGYERPKQNKNQSRYTQMIIMQMDNAKLIVGVRKDKKKIQYCITAIT